MSEAHRDGSQDGPGGDKTGPQSGDEEARRAAVASLSGGDEALARLIGALGDESWRVRKEATLRAAAWADAPRAASALAEALAEPENVGRRNAAVEALSRMGAVALPPLLAALELAPEHRKLIVDTLGLIGDRRAAPAVVPALDDADPNVRSAAAEALGHIGGEQAEAALAAQLGRIDPSELIVMLACLDALTALGAALPVSRLAALLEMPVLRPAALAALGGSRDPSAAGILVSHLADRSRAVRESATVALARLYESQDAGATREAVARKVAPLSDEVERLLVIALLDGGSSTRRAAATVLGLCGRPTAARPLVLALGDYAVEEAAGAALLRLGVAGIGPIAAMAPDLDPSLRGALFRPIPGLGPDPRLEALLRDELLHGDGELSSEAAHALGEIGGSESIAALVEALRGAAPAAAEAALCRLASRLPDEVRACIAEDDLSGDEGARFCRMLGACRLPADVPVLLGLLGGSSAVLRAAAAEALAQHGAALDGAPPAQRVVEALAAVLADPLADVRASAARALAAFPSPAASKSLCAAASDADSGVRAAVAWALGSIGGAEARATLAARERVEGDPLVHAVISAALSGGGAR